MAQGNRPVHEERIGSIKAAIWANNTAAGIRHSVTFVRLYKDGEEWKTSDSFGRDDLLMLNRVSERAFDWICAQASSSS